jgi:glycerol-3-phosphate cytidylyltransferase
MGVTDKLVAKRVIITYGTFDLFHIGHLRLLERAKRKGDFLIVAVSTDDFNSQKNKRSFFTYEERSEIVGSCKYVDRVIPENNWNQKSSDIREFGVHTLVMGDDWNGKFDHLSDFCEVVYLSRTPGISSSRVRMLSGSLLKDSLVEDLKSATNLLHSVVSRFEDLE